MSKDKHLKLELNHPDHRKEYVVRNLDCIIVPGVLRYRDIPVTEFTKEQLIAILYQMTFVKDE